jgi:hypothetical protein
MDTGRATDAHNRGEAAQNGVVESLYASGRRLATVLLSIDSIILPSSECMD